MPNSRRPRRTASARLGALMATVALIGCGGGTPASSATATTSSTGAPTEAPSAAPTIQTSGFEALGPVTLELWIASGTPEDTGILALVEAFETTYPNVTVNITYRSFSDYMRVIHLRLASPDSPDVVQGNMGYQLDSRSVREGLIVPLDDYAAAYGWTDVYTPAALSQYRLQPDGTWDGETNLYGIGHAVDQVGVFYNRAKLRELGFDGAPATMAEFEQVLAAAKAAGTTPIVLGNLEGIVGTHVWASLWTHYGTALEMREWLFGLDGRTVDTPAARQATDKAREWASEGYFGEGFAGLNYGDAIGVFGNGDGAFLISGTWLTGPLTGLLGDDLGFMNFPAGPDGTYDSVGSLSLPFEISAKAEHPDLAAALIDALVSEGSASILLDHGRIPGFAVDAPATASVAVVDNINSWAQVLEDSGVAFYPDWATSTMLDLQVASLQELFAGRLSTDDFLARLQQNWEEFQQTRKQGG